MHFRHPAMKKYLQDIENDYNVSYNTVVYFINYVFYCSYQLGMIVPVMKINRWDIIGVFM